MGFELGPKLLRNAPKGWLPARAFPESHSASSYSYGAEGWEREARVRREVTRRGGGIDAVLGKLSNPLIGKLRPEDEPHVQAAIERQGRREREFQPVRNPVLEAAGVEIKRRMDDLERISREGRKVSAVVVDRVEFGRRLGTMPVIDLVFELEGRHVPFEHVFGPRHAKRYTVGARVDVWVDPNDPNAICPGR